MGSDFTIMYLDAYKKFKISMIMKWVSCFKQEGLAFVNNVFVIYVKYEVV